MSNPNKLYKVSRIGLDEVTDQRNRIVAMDVPDLACSDVRDAIVLALDILTQVLIEHFPLMAESQNRPKPPKEHKD